MIRFTTMLAEFNRYYQKLNSEQKEAVDTIEGPVMVIAGPGTGKTTVLTLRIAQILQKTDIPPSGILAITYTDAGVKVMRQKLRNLIGARADEVKIHTFHGFAVSVIRDYPDHFPHLSNTEPATEIELRGFIQKILESKEFSELRPMGRPDLFVDPILKAISNAKKEAHTPEMLKAYGQSEIKKIEDDESEISSRGVTKGELKAEAKKMIQRCRRTILLSEIYSRYEELKKAEKKIDFDDMIFELQQALRKDELLLRLLQEQFLYLLVDEHQDTNDSQNMLILMIAEFFDTPNVFIVGDEKQAIYRFQGASVENFLKFQKIWRDVRLIQLAQSFRSHQKILDAGFHLIEHNYQDGEHEDLRVELKAGKNTSGRPIKVVVGKNITDSEEFLISRLNGLLKVEKETEIALIVRTNDAVARLKRLCESRGIEVVSVRNVDIFDHPTGRLFFDLLSAVVNPLDNESLGRTITAGLWDLSIENQIETLKGLRRDGGIKKGAVAKKLQTLHDSMLSGDPIGFIFEVATLSGYVRKISSEAERVEIWRGIIKFSETVLRSRKNPSDSFGFVEELLAYRDLAGEKQVKVASGDPEARIKIMTAHGSKGLEFDYVFIVYATESFWMKKSPASFFALPFETNSPDESVKDSRRLFYVALTRAKKHVEILTHEELENGETDLALRFISELGEENIEIKRLPKAHKPAPTKFKDKNQRLRAGYQEEAKRVITENGISVTALNNFLECPNKFIYRSVLKLPELSSPSSEKGTAMHSALAYVFRTRPSKNLEKIIQKKSFEYLDLSLLKDFEKEVLKKTLEKEIPIIAKELKEHFKISGKINVEKSVSAELKFFFKNKKVKIPIHGRLDLVVEDRGQISVFDYKTKEAMSPREIMGQTKNSSGDYFRQLVFYTILLSKDIRYKGQTINSYLVFLTPNERGKIKFVTLPVQRSDIENLESQIKTLVEDVYSGRILDSNCHNPKCVWCGLKKATGV